MRTDTRKRPGQAMYEFAIACFVFAFVVSLFVQYAPMLIRNLDMLDAARTDAGVAALQGVQGSRSTALGGGARIAAHVQPKWPAPGGQDAWAYPVKALPNETRFDEWRSGRPRPTSLVYGTAKDRFTIPVWFDADGHAVEEDIHISEEVFFPALGQPRGTP